MPASVPRRAPCSNRSLRKCDDEVFLVRLNNSRRHPMDRKPFDRPAEKEFAPRSRRNSGGGTVGLSESIRQTESKPTRINLASQNEALAKGGAALRKQLKLSGKISKIRGFFAYGRVDPYSRARASLLAAAEIATAVSRKKQVFSNAASSGVSGGDNRVLTFPARGALSLLQRVKAARN